MYVCMYVCMYVYIYVWLYCSFPDLPREPQFVELLHSVGVSEHHLAIFPNVLYDTSQLHALQLCRPDYISGPMN